MILVDAGVLIDYLRTKELKLDRLFRSEPVAVCGVTRAEILAGARSNQERAKLLHFLGTFQQVFIPGGFWDSTGNNLAALYAGGLTVPFPDALLATVAIENDVQLWARDAHFLAMRKILTRLNLFTEPP